MNWSMVMAGYVQQRRLNAGLNLYLLQLAVLLHKNTATARGCVNKNVYIHPQRLTSRRPKGYNANTVR